MDKELMEVTFKAEMKEFYLDGTKCIVGFVSGKSLLKKTFPNGPNSRNYMDKKNKNVSKMIKTLKTSPETFVFKNNGIRMIAETYVKNEDGTFSVYFKKEDGVFNGNHTEIVLSKYGRDKSYVLLVIFLKIPKDSIADISVANNSTTPIKEISRGEKLGKYKWIKKIFPDYQISYTESDIAELNIATILQIAGIYQIDKKNLTFINKDYRNFKSFLRNKGKLVEKHNNDQITLWNTSYILKDITDYYISIRSDNEYISLIQKKLKNKKWIQGGYINDTLILNFINALNFAFKIPAKTLCPYYVHGYNMERLKSLTKKVFPLIITELKKYEEEGLKIIDICRDHNLYQEIQNMLMQADLEEINKSAMNSD